MVAEKTRWKDGRSCGPYMVSHEALKAISSHPKWGDHFREIFNDMLHTAKIVEAVERGIIVLLIKQKQLIEWNETRPRTLNSVLLKTFS